MVDMLTAYTGYGCSILFDIMALSSAYSAGNESRDTALGIGLALVSYGLARVSSFCARGIKEDIQKRRQAMNSVLELTCS